MEKEKFVVRMADIRDAQEMLDIYVPYVKETAAGRCFTYRNRR